MEVTGRGFPHLMAARDRTSAELSEVNAKLIQIPHDAGISVVLMGSWGRAEVTNGSDHDFMILADSGIAEVVNPSVARVGEVLDQEPGDQDIFSKPVFVDRLEQNIGLDGDSNTNLTHRMLFLLESRAATGPEIYESCMDRLLNRYLGGPNVKDFRPPRFLLNDVVRYWRTMSVDFAAKEFKGPEKWGLRNAKLRLSRKILFAGGLLPVLRCFEYSSQDIPSFLREQLSIPPTDRLADAFLAFSATDAGGRAIGAYDTFVGILDDSDQRSELKNLTREAAETSELFQTVRDLGREFQSGLLALLFETEDLPNVVRDYAIF